MEMNENSQYADESLDWLYKTLCPTSTQKKRKPKEWVTFKQRELLLNFISENPEIITHSSTQESETTLWKELKDQLNELKPEKTLDFWRGFFRRWKNSVEEKPEQSLTLIDYKFKKFLNNLGNGCCTEEKRNRQSLTFEQIKDELKNIEEEKSTIKLEIDEIDYNIIRQRKSIKEMKKTIVQKRKRIRELTQRKGHLQNKKNKIILKQKEC